MCGFAAAVLESTPPDAAALILTTTCDQMRRAAGLEDRTPCPVFLLNVPATWQTDSARRLYADELTRLGVFLKHLGGRDPGPGVLTVIMDGYQEWRRNFRLFRARATARQCAEVLYLFHRDGPSTELPEPPEDNTRGGIPLLLLGGPLCQSDWAVLDRLEEFGGRVVVDGTETGERSWPGSFKYKKSKGSSFDTLTEAYFGAIPDIFRRPNDTFYQWLDKRTLRYGPRGAVMLRRRWCDLWNGETERIRETLHIPLLVLDMDGDAEARHSSRVEAFLEMLR